MYYFQLYPTGTSQLMCVLYICILQEPLTTYSVSHDPPLCFGDGSSKVLVFSTGFSRKAVQRGCEIDDFPGTHTSKAIRK